MMRWVAQAPPASGTSDVTESWVTLVGMIALIGVTLVVLVQLGRLWRYVQARLGSSRALPFSTDPDAGAEPVVDPEPVRPVRRQDRPAPAAGASRVAAVAHDMAQRPSPAAAPARAEPADPIARAREAVTQLPARVAAHLDVSLDLLALMEDATGRQLGMNLLASMHWRICGASRSGKGNFLQLIALLALRLGPKQAWVWVLDPKSGLDYRAFAHTLDHARLYANVYQMTPQETVATDPVSGKPIPLFDGTLTDGYRAAVAEMRRRERVMGDAGARNHVEYRAITGEQLPILILVADEIGEITDDERADLCTLARMGAASGIVLLVATQYPTADILPSQVQSNTLNSVVFQFATPKYTQVAMGLPPGEKPMYDPSGLGARGVAIYRNDTGREVVCRVPEVTDELRSTLIRWLKERYPRRSSGVVAEQAPRAARQPVIASDLDLDFRPEAAPLPMVGSDDGMQLLAELLERNLPERWTDKHIRATLALASAKLRGSEVGKLELARILYPDNQHGGSGGYTRLAENCRMQVGPMVDWLVESVRRMPTTVDEDLVLDLSARSGTR